MIWGVVTFPGSNCDRDCLHALRHALGFHAERVWHQDRSLAGIDALVLPGGFSYGDYLRTGAVAATSPIMEAVREFASAGLPVLGICNGFQILTEARLLPGTLMRNAGLRFRCRPAWVRVESTRTPFTSSMRRGDLLHLPIAHGEGGYWAGAEEIASLEEGGRIAFRYCDPEGLASQESNPNGSVANVAGVASVEGNVVGLMPHPERASEALLGSADGLALFESAARHMALRAVRAPGRAR